MPPCQELPIQRRFAPPPSRNPLFKLTNFFNGIKKYEPVSRTHAGLVDILQIGRNNRDGDFYYVMELADDWTIGSEGADAPPDELTTLDRPSPPHEPKIESPRAYQPKTLSQLLASTDRLPARECLHIAVSICGGLVHLHRSGLIHRDFKPANIIFVNGEPKLADIGLVTDSEGSQTFVGTEGFIPREDPSTPQSDLYSLGKVLYEMGTGKDRTRFPELPTKLGNSPDDQFLLPNFIPPCYPSRSWNHWRDLPSSTEN